jgi:hypothetical protein
MRPRRSSKRHPGPVYDTAIRGVLEGDPSAVCRLLGILVTTPGQKPVVLSTSFAYPVGALYADLVMRVGPGRLVHIECERKLSADEMVARMLGYRGVIQRRHRGEVLSQYLLVLEGGRVSEFIDPVLSWFWRRLGVLFLRDVDPEMLLAEPSLAPLAVLGRGDQKARVQVLGRALAVVRDEGGERATELRAFAVALARIRLEESTINNIVREVDVTPQEFMAEMIWNGNWGAEIRRDMRNKFTKEGLVEGREQGREQGREHLLVALIQDRFGAHPDTSAVAEELIGRMDDREAVHAVTSATSLADLTDLVGTRS